ncbi:MAG: 2-oxo-4-hydroxy-4-carboxy-5-ureidoimidazoline decarboxylase [Rubrobacter sp.]
MPTLAEINAMSHDEFVKRFGSLYEGSPWVAQGAVKDRPFENAEELHAAFERVVEAASDEERLTLIQAHPDLAGKAAVSGKLTDESAREQASAGLNRLMPGEFDAFTRMNREYEERFGIPMIVCVREHSKESMLRQAEERLGNSYEEEIRVALGEIAKITHLRLLEIVEEGTGR